MKPFKGATWDGIRWTGIPPVRKMRRALRRISLHARTSNLIYTDRRKWFLEQEENKWCPVARAGLIPNPVGEMQPHWRRSEQIHHAWRRGKYLLEDFTWIGVSRHGHRWIENNPKEAREKGWLCDTPELQFAYMENKFNKTNAILLQQVITNSQFV